MDTARADEVLRRDSSPMSFLLDIAASHTEFTDAKANAPWTLPSHGTLFSGQYPSVHGAHAAHKSFEYEPTLPTLLDRAGYQTVGISNNTWVSGEFGYERGFDEFYTTWKLFQDGVDFGDVARMETGLASQLRGILRKFRGNPVKNAANLLYGQFFRKRYDDGAKKTNQIVSDHLDSWVEGSPLFLFVNYLEPHLEYHPPSEHMEQHLPADVSTSEANAVNQDAWAYITGDVSMSERDFEILRSLYRAELAYLDERLRELYQMFEAAGIANNTIFLITGDHGENIGDHNLMDHQYSLHEELLNVPLVAAGGDFESGETVHRPVQLADIPPTVLDFADAPIPDRLPGQSLRDPTALPENRHRLSEYLAPQPQIETLKQQYECRQDIDQYDRRLRSLTHDGWKFIRGSDGSEFLFDLSQESAEETSLVDDNPETAQRLRTRLDDIVAELPSVEDTDVSISQSTEERLEDLGYLQ